MSSTSRRSAGPGGELELVLAWSGIAAVALVLLVASLSAHLALLFSGVRERLPANPVALVLELLDGRLAWPAGASEIGGGLLAASLIVIAGVAYSLRAWRPGHVDRAARWMGRGLDIDRLSARRADGVAARFGVAARGLPIARAIASGRTLYAGWEDVSVDIWGPRTGKTTSRAIPSILAAPGAALVTSNKRDVVDATRDPRGETDSVWVFDPQQIADEPPGWWWNPLGYVTDEVRAAELADVFALSSRDPGARTDAYFDTAAQNLLAALLLAAALDRRALTQVHLWLTSPNDDEAVHILREHRYEVLAAALQAQVNAPDKQRGGVFGTAQEMCACLTNRQAMRWVTPDPGERRPQFDPARFAASRETLYSLSKEGRGSCAALVTALTLAVCEAAEELAKRSPAGRLPVPMVVALDEAANVCRWRKLPELYSHYGSRGICLLTILQSWSQGAEVWGKDGMSKLWSAATIKVYGGGVSEVEFLEQLSRLIGDFDLESRSLTHASRGGGRSVNRSVRRERILDVADLGALPAGRVVVFASGAKPTLARSIPWMAGRDAGRVRASIAAHDPASRGAR